MSEGVEIEINVVVGGSHNWDQRGRATVTMNDADLEEFDWDAAEGLAKMVPTLVATAIKRHQALMAKKEAGE